MATVGVMALRLSRMEPSGSISANCGTRARAWRRSLIRWDNCWAAFLVKVRPNTCSGAQYPLATSQTTRAAIVSVLPAPAPATTSMGPGGAPIIAACWGVGGCSWPNHWDRVTGSTCGLVDIGDRLSFRVDWAHHFRRTGVAQALVDCECFHVWPQ